MKKEDFPANRATDLGEYLGIKPGRLSALKVLSGGDPHRLLSVIIEWFNNDSEKSWLKLAKALKNCGHSLIAEKLAPQEGMHEFDIIESVIIFFQHDNDSYINDFGSHWYINNMIANTFSTPKIITPLQNLCLKIAIRNYSMVADFLML